MPLDRRTRATLRSAELGFLGVWVNTRVHTPRRCGAPLSAGVFIFVVVDWRPLRTSCWMVGTRNLASDGWRGTRGRLEGRRRRVKTDGTAYGARCPGGNLVNAGKRHTRVAPARRRDTAVPGPIGAILTARSS